MSVIHDKIQVIVRIRPPRKEESNLSTRVNFNSVVCKEKIYNYDNVYDCDSQQYSIFEQSVKPLLNHFLSGINTTIFAYGQTGAGKTYTMGTDQNNVHFQDNDNWGIIPRFLYEMFNLKSSPNHKYEFAIQFLELYNEEIRDLLISRSQHSNIRITDCKQGVILHGLSEKSIYSVIEALFYLNEGNKSRTTASTAMNSESSRSHSIFIFNLTQTKVNEETGVTEIIKSKFNFVDLAGSERLQRTKATGVRAKEGININFGLLVLGNVISALSENGLKNKRHVPYRDSKLTRLLEDSLGGNSKCMMIACVCPSSENVAETYNTLIYASRVANIENKISVNKKTILNDNNCNHCQQLKNRIKELEKEIEDLKNQSNNCSLFENKVHEIIDNHRKITQGNYENVMGNFTSFCNLASLEHNLRFLETIPNTFEDNSTLYADKQAYRQKISSMKIYSFQGSFPLCSEKANLNEFFDKLTIESKLNNLKMKNFINNNLEDQEKVNPVKFHEYRWNYLLNFVCKKLILKDCLQEELIRYYEDKLTKFYRIFRIYLQISYPTPDVIKDLLTRIQKFNLEADNKYFPPDNPFVIFESLESVLNRLFPIVNNKPSISLNFQSKTSKSSKESCDKEESSSNTFVKEKYELKKPLVINKPEGTLNQNLNPLKRKRSMILNFNGKIDGKTFLKDNGLCLPIIPSPVPQMNLFPLHNNRSIFSSISNKNTYRPVNIVADFRRRNLLNLKK